MTADTIEVIGSASPSPDERPQTTSETGQNSPLLSLPLEVFQIIIRHMDAGTFYASLLTCRHFLKAARCKPNIKRHLYSLPGLRLGLDDVSTSALLLQFRRRAAESGCAAGVLADVTRYQQTSRTSLSNAVFSPADPSHSGGQAYVATVHNGGIVHVYDLGNHHVRLKAELHVRPQDGNDGRMEIVKKAFAPESRDLGVLYRHVPSSNTFHVGSLGHTVYKLVTFHYLYARTKGYFYDSHQQETRDIEVPDVEVPVGLALASNGRACMACKSQIEEDSTNVTLIGRDHKLMEACDYDSCPQIMMIKDPPGLPYHNFKDRQVFRMQFVRHDHTLNLYKPGDPIHSWYTHALSPFESECGPVFRNQALIDTGAKELFGYSECELGMPFHGAHFDGQPDPLCQNSYLALGISRNVNEISGHPNAFVVQADCHVRAAGCNHKMDLDNGRRVTSWKPVALLAGWRKGESSLGTVVATSPGGTRVAAATWSRILVWSFNPKLLHQGELRHYFPIRDYNQRKEFGRLRPTLLTPAGVVHNMIWTDETHLYATTDQGLVNWDIGPKSDGERHELTLAYDAWPDTAVAIPALPHKLQNRQWGFT